MVVLIKEVQDSVCLRKFCVREWLPKLSSVTYNSSGNLPSALNHATLGVSISYFESISVLVSLDKQACDMHV